MKGTNILFVIFSIIYCVNCRLGKFDSSYAYLLVTNEKTAAEHSFCVNFEQWKTQKIASSPSDAETLRLGWWGGIVNNTNVCRKNASLAYDGEAVALNYRLERQDGPCALPFVFTNTSFKGALQYQVNELSAQQTSAALMLVDKGRVYNGRWSDYLFLDFYDPDLNMSTALPIFFIYKNEFFNGLLALSADASGQDLKLQFYRPPSTALDVSLLIVWLLAVFCVGVGGYWAGHRKLCEEQTSAVKKMDQIVPSDSSDRTKDCVNDDKMVTHVNCFFIILVMLIVVGVLMLGFYFRSIMVHVFNVILMVIGTFSVHRCVSALFGSIFKCGHCRVCVSMNDVTRSIFRRDLFNCECCSERPRVASLLIFVGSLALCVTWFVLRRSPYAFVLLDFINVTVCLHVLKGIRFPNLKWLTVLLLCMFAYDVFMVFGTPFLTKSGCSVMVEVAAGSDCSKDDIGYPVAPVESEIPEKLPMLFQVPRLGDPMISCVDLEIEKEYRPIILGLGDIIVPGYLISFCFTADFAVSTRYIYGALSIVGYGIGLLVTFAALTVMQMAQPALIYLIPFTLLPIVVLAWLRGELKLLWTGNFLKLDETEPVLEEYGTNNANYTSESAGRTDNSSATALPSSDFEPQTV